MRIDIATLFPEMCEAVLCESIIGRAREAGLLEVYCHNIRDYTQDKHRRVDDTPYGGGMGMVMQADPIFRCYEAVCAQLPQKPHVIYLVAAGKGSDPADGGRIFPAAIPVFALRPLRGSGRTVLEEIVDEELSIGDYVLTGGELPALVFVDTVGRLCEGVLADESCFTEESHFNGLLEYPQYSRPAVWHEKEVPAVLLSGHHANICRWRREQSLLRTRDKRPDLLEKAVLDAGDLAFLDGEKRIK